MVQPCEVTVGTLKKSIAAWRRANLKPVSKMRVADLEREFINFPLADQFLPNGLDTDTVNAATARKTISAYRRHVAGAVATVLFALQKSSCTDIRCCGLSCRRDPALIAAARDEGAAPPQRPRETAAKPEPEPEPEPESRNP